MKCPFCQKDLHKDSDGYYTCYTDNCDCWANGGNGASGSESLWLTLIRTRKALDVATGAIDKILYLDSGKFCKEPAEMWKIAKSAKDKITALEQKDK